MELFLSTQERSKEDRNINVQVRRVPEPYLAGVSKTVQDKGIYNHVETGQITSGDDCACLRKPYIAGRKLVKY